jgi:hypothetical protein
MAPVFMEDKHKEVITWRDVGLKIPDDIRQKNDSISTHFD